ncbi:hypothetical protein [Streptomyces olivochromogenes]|uniref:hypothetical protein n=1 Tax=Streptomyces olivochromogenes TaxID=1963 RepID=UPI001F208341|nr:hypothetical protein [Streptomyces olivochromogenes]MCF3130239.1 hypothetical protein [Streptomyces olivochromogenes]
MTGSGEDWLNDGLDMAGSDSGLWVSGVDYIAGWREAHEAADRLNRALLAVGFELSAVRAVASADEGGRGVVRLAGRTGAVERLTRLLEGSRGHGGAA